MLRNIVPVNSLQCLQSGENSSSTDGLPLGILNVLKIPELSRSKTLNAGRFLLNIYGMLSRRGGGGIRLCGNKQVVEAVSRVAKVSVLTMISCLCAKIMGKKIPA